MPGTTTAVLDPAMKVIANEPLVNNVMAESQLADLFDSDFNVQTDQTTGGRYIERANIFGLPAGVGARAEDDNLPEADDPDFKNTRIPLRSVYGVLEMTGHVMRRVVGDEGAFLNYAEEAFPLFAKRVASELDRMLVGYGFGIIGRCAGTMSNVAGTTYTLALNRAYGVTGYTGVWRQLLEGQRLVFSSSASATALRNAGTGQSAKVLDVDEATDTVTLEVADAALAAAVALNDYVFPGDAAGHSGQVSGVNREPQGLLAGVDDGNILATYLNLARSSKRQHKGIVIDAANAALGFGGQMSEDLLVYADEEVQQRTGQKVSAIVMSYSAARGYWKSLKSDRSFVNPRAYMGGKGPLSVQLTDREVMLKVGRKLPDQLCFGLATPEWKKFMLGQWEWDDKTGSVWNRVVTTSGRKDRFYAVGFMDLEVATRWCRANFRLDNLAVTY